GARALTKAESRFLVAVRTSRHLSRRAASTARTRAGSKGKFRPLARNDGDYFLRVRKHSRGRLCYTGSNRPFFGCAAQARSAAAHKTLTHCRIRRIVAPSNLG